MAPPNPFEYFRSIAKPDLPSGDTFDWCDAAKGLFSKFIADGFLPKENFANEKGFLYGSQDAEKRIQFKFFFKHNALKEEEKSQESPKYVGELEGLVHFGSSSMGPPGFVHGGAIATLADQAMGEAVWYAFTPAVTANLNINYRTPIPLDSDARLSVKVPATERRKANVTFTIKSLDESILYAEGTALFVQPKGWETVPPEQA